MIQSSLGITQEPISKIINDKVLGHGSSGGAPAKQAQSPELKS
jgi:hypothetical protein